MSKGKKGGKGAVASDSGWDEGLTNESLSNDVWVPFVAFITESSPSSIDHLEVLKHAIESGSRRKFMVISRELLLETARQDAKLATGGGGGGRKSKTASALSEKKPLFVEVCEQVVSSGDTLPAALEAKMIKYCILKKRSADIQKYEALKKAEEEAARQRKNSDSKGGKKEKGGGKGKAAGKKGKDTPAVEDVSAIPPPDKPTSTMKKRGEDEKDSQFIDDEPIDGPNCYIVFTGFNSAEVLEQLTVINSPVNAVVKFLDTCETTSNSDLPDEEKEVLIRKAADLSQFWSCLSKNNSTLQDMVVLDFLASSNGVPVTSDEKVVYGQKIFSDLAEMFYGLLEKHSLYKHYLDVLNIQHLPRHESSDQTSKMNNCYYSELINSIPEEACTVAEVLHCMVEQVSSDMTSSTKSVGKGNLKLDAAVNLSIHQAVNSLSLPTDYKEKAVLQLSDVKPSIDVEKKSSGLMHWQDRNAFQLGSLLPRVQLGNCIADLASAETSLRELHELEHFCVSPSVSKKAFHNSLLLFSLENIALPVATNLPAIIACSKLLYDSPISFELKNESSSEVDCIGLLDIPESKSDMSDYTVYEYLPKVSYLHLLDNLVSSTHPYVQVFHHKLNTASIVVAHTGFNEQPLLQYDWSEHVHSPLSFQHYLIHVNPMYSSKVKESLINCKEGEHKNESRPTTEMKLEAKKERTPTSAGKVSKEPAVVGDDLTNRVPKLFSAYDVNNRLLLCKGQVSTQFTADGIQIRTEKQQLADNTTSLLVTLWNGTSHRVSVSVAKHNSVIDQHPSTEQLEPGHPESPTCEMNEHSLLPPSPVTFSALTATFKDCLTLSMSTYGPNGNGKLSFLPPHPTETQEETTQVTSAVSSRPHSQVQSPQKMSKKQQEQLVQQQRLQQEQEEKRKEQLLANYEKKFKSVMRHNKYQQLFASTPFGLHIHCQVMVDLLADVSIQDGTDGFILIKQNYPTKKCGLKARGEKNRCYLPNGVVVIFFLDESVVVICSDGSIYRSLYPNEQKRYMNIRGSLSNSDVTSSICKRIDSANKVSFSDDRKVEDTCLAIGMWMITMPDGSQYVYREESVSASSNQESTEENEQIKQHQVHIALTGSILAYPATDPVTNEVLVTREDGVRIVKHPDGTIITEHKDGTRFTTSPADTTVIECPGFARVKYSTSQKCMLTLPDNTDISCTSNGSYVISKEGSFKLSASSQGDAIYSPCSNEHYNFNYTGISHPFNVKDSAGNSFKVSSNGDTSVHSASSLSAAKLIPSHTNFHPQYFVLNENNKVFQLQSRKEVDKIISDAQSKASTKVFSNNKQSTMIVKPFDDEESSVLPYLDETIVPFNLRVSTFSKSSYYSIPKLRYRHFEFNSDSSDNLRSNIGCSLAKYVKWKTSDEKSMDALLVKETNSEKLTVEEADLILSELDQEAIYTKYKESFSNNLVETTRQLDTSVDREKIAEEAAVELQKANEIKLALKSRDLPSYFSSKQSESYNSRAQPDLTSLAAKLPKPTEKSPKSDEMIRPSSGHSTPNTLTSLSVNTIDVDSSSRSEVESHPRPLNPTPNHANKRSSIDTQPLVALPEDEAVLSKRIQVADKQIGSIPKEASMEWKSKSFSTVSIAPKEVNFGTTLEGSVYVHSVLLKNTGRESLRFKVKQPPLSTGLRILYTPGPVAAGLSRKLDIELYAVTILGGIGDFGTGSMQYDVEIVTESGVLHLPVKATIVTASNASLVSLTEGSLLMGERSTARNINPRHKSTDASSER